jgi:hypothetical protein
MASVRNCKEGQKEKVQRSSIRMGGRKEER